MSGFEYFDNLFDPVLVLNLKREIVYFNHQSPIFFKLPPRILKSKQSIIQLCDSTDLDLEEWVSKALLSFDVLTSPEIRLHLPHDPESEYNVIMKVVPLQSEKGANFALVFHDKTVETQLHYKYRDQMEELKKTHSQILQADKLNTLGELTANISHEINNPLTIAAGHCELIRDSLLSKDPASRIKMIESANNTVIESLERVNQIIKNMKDFLHKSEDEKEYCDLDTLVDAAIEWILPTAKKAGVEVKKINKGKNVAALANRIKLEQVLINLVKNSIDAINAASVPHGQVNIVISKSENEHHTYIDVVDNGPGIPEKIKPNLFKPFMSTKDAGTGTGLGLSICAKIIEAHRGKLENIERADGAHFRIRLPMIEIYSYTRNDKSLTGQKKEKRILVLDNEVQILNVLNSFIRDEGYVFIGSSDPLDALKFLSKANIDLMVTDFSMPLMNGGEFSRLAREAGYDGPILYMTSAKFIDQYNKDKRVLDIDGLILKPFNRDEVMKTIRSALKVRGAA
ncbi:MAG: ATP-binding protein [Bacteriovoracaceae bacterium]